MAGLNLISVYNSSDSESDEKEEEKQMKVMRSLPLPESILSWQGVPHHEEVYDNPTDHQGRIRSFKHERGNWATLVYINYTASESMLYWIKSIVTKSLLEGKTLFQEFHISLTRTLILKFHWIQSFVDALKRITWNVHQFSLILSDMKIYCNEERTRTFLGISCYSKDGSLEYLIKALDKLLTEYQLPSFYEDPSYHISICWWLGDKEAELKELLPSIITSFEKYLAEYTEENFVLIKELYCKIGNKLYTFHLK